VEPQEKLYNLLEKDSRYPLPAYAAIHKGLDFTMKTKQVVGHVDGQELAIGMAGYLKEEYGPFCRMVLSGWGIRSTMDFGCLVFNLIDAGLMRKQDTDSIEDFTAVYDFEETFDEPHDWLAEIREELGLSEHKPDPSR
jgi:uncharacterized repeat protein (TIGR04138 family)